MAFLILLFTLTALLYIIPIIIFLPFHMSFLQEIGLFFITVLGLLPIAFITGNIGVLFLLGIIILYLSFINHHWLLNVCIVIISYLLNVIVDNLESSCIYLLFKITSDSLYQSHIYHLSFTVAHMVIIYLLSRLLLHFFTIYRKNANIIKLPSGTLFFICLQLILTFLLFITNIVEGQQVGYSPKVIYFNTFVFCAYFFISLWAIIRSIQIYKKDAEMQMKQESFQALQQYTAQVESLYNSLRSFKHDYSNILLTLYEYIDTRDMDGLTSYFTRNILPLTKQLDPQNAHITRLSNLNIVELKSMVTAKIIYAQEMGIDVSVEINQPLDRVNMDIIDLVRILGIFLDNAIEAALETDTPKMSFVIIQEDKETVFFMTNSFIDHHLQISELSKAGTSSKGSSRGIGLYNVAQIISHYDNLFLDTHTQGDTFMQVLHIYT